MPSGLSYLTRCVSSSRLASEKYCNGFCLKERVLFRLKMPSVCASQESSLRLHLFCLWCRALWSGGVMSGYFDNLLSSERYSFHPLFNLYGAIPQYPYLLYYSGAELTPKGGFP